MNTRSKNLWKCDVCKEDNSSVGSKSDVETGDDMQSIGGMIMSLRADINGRFDKQLERFDSMEANYASLTHTFASLSKAFEGFQKEFEEHKKEVMQLKEEKEVLAREVVLLKDSLNELQQYTRKMNIEVRGVPVTRGEDIYEVVKTIAIALKIPYQREDISIAHRLGGTSPGQHPAIIIQFISRTTRSNWLLAAKRMTPKLSTTDLHGSLAPGPVFLNEHLSPHNRGLLGAARRMVRDKRIAFAWTGDGKVLVRKSPDSGVVWIRHLCDLQKL